MQKVRRMRKLAFFVEGQTDAIFVSRLLEEIADKHQVIIERRQASGGRKRIRTLELVERSEDMGQEYYVLIYDCMGDSTVTSDICEQYDSLVRDNYQAIVGIRDVYPKVSYKDIPKLRQGLASGLKTKPIEVVFALAIMEIEAWFIAEHTHFTRISPNLTLERIIAGTGFDPSQDNIELRPHPSGDLCTIYRLEGFVYRKKRGNVERTVNALDYARLYLELGQKIPDLQRVLDCIDSFLSHDAGV